MPCQTEGYDETGPSKRYELSEVVTPAAPTSARHARLFIRDAGGKTQLCIRFRTGALKVLATET